MEIFKQPQKSAMFINGSYAGDIEFSYKEKEKEPLIFGIYEYVSPNKYAIPENYRLIFRCES